MSKAKAADFLDVVVMDNYQFDLLVIGAGSGGIRASRSAAQLGARVAIVESNGLGGTCINLGCVPKKLLVYASQYHDAPQKAASFGWQVENVQFDWHVLRKNKDNEIAHLNEIYRQLLREANVELITGYAKLLDPHKVQVGDSIYSAEKILIATGGRPYVPDFPGREYVFTSDDAFHLPSLPQSLMIVGGGYIGVEFAGIFNGLGVETHLCHSKEMLLNGFDDDLRSRAAEEISRKGVHIHLNCHIEQVEKISAEQFIVIARDGRRWQVGGVMYATGRRANTQQLGLENTRVVIDDRGSIEVDDYFQTAEPSIYALGDVVGRKALTPVALAEAGIFTRYVFAGQREAIDYDAVPTAIFCQPPIATVGLTETRAREIYRDIDVYQSAFKPLQFSLAHSDEKIFMKLLVDRATDRVVGCHMLGADAAEIMQGFAVAMTAGVTKADFDRTMGIHPTLAEEFVVIGEPLATLNV
jgi:glutathione reductase (NADPH)